MDIRNSCRLCLQLIKDPNIKDATAKTKKFVKDAVKIEIQGEDLRKRVCDECLHKCITFQGFQEVVKHKQATGKKKKIKTETGEYVEIKVELGDCCLLCLNEKNIEHLRPGRELVECALRTFFDVKINSDSKICDTCNESLMTFHPFYQEVHDNQLYVKKDEEDESENEFIETNVDVNVEFLNELKPSPAKRFICDYCQSCYANKDTLKRHFIRKHAKSISDYNSAWLEKRYECKKCWQKFTTQEKHRDHVDTYHKKIGVKCSKCKERFANHHKRKLHMQKKHMADAAYHCADCDQRFKTAGHYKRHTENSICKNPKYTKVPGAAEKKLQNRYPCDVCDERLATSWGLQRHKEIKHSDYKRRYICQECHRTFKRRDKATSHKGRCVKRPVEHEAANEYLCVRCDESHADVKSILRHQKTCTYVRPVHSGLLLTIEERNFAKQHMGLVDGDRFGCLFCAKTFAMRGNCYNHIRLFHMNMEPYYCDCCSLQFRNKSGLRAHFKYRQQRDYREWGTQYISCGICGAKFHCENDLSGHYRRSHAPLKTCKICLMGTRNLELHTVTAHAYEVVSLDEYNVDIKEEDLDL